MSEKFHSGQIALDKCYYIKFYVFINEGYHLTGSLFMILHEIIQLFH